MTTTRADGGSGGGREPGSGGGRVPRQVLGQEPDLHPLPGAKPLDRGRAGQREGAPHGSHPGQAAKSPRATRLPGASGSAPQASPGLSTATSTPSRVGSEDSAATDREVSVGRMRTEAGSIAGGRSSRQAATAIPGSGAGRFPAASRTSSRTGASRPAGRGPPSERERISGEIARGVPGTRLHRERTGDRLGEPHPDLLQVDRAPARGAGRPSGPPAARGRASPRSGRWWRRRACARWGRAPHGRSPSGCRFPPRRRRRTGGRAAPPASIRRGSRRPSA